MLLLHERTAIAEFVNGFDQAGFDVFLAQAHCPPLSSFSSSVKAMPVIAMEFLSWLDLNMQRCGPMLQAALQGYSAHASAPVFRDLLARLEAGAAATVHLLPWDVCLATGVPVVNRSRLREVLRDKAGGVSGCGITLVDGPSGSGRTHSWYLIQHVADSIPGLKALKIDLNANIAEQQTIRNVFRRLTTLLGAPADEPTTVGATPETIAGRYAEEVELAVARAPALRAWVVFDSLDRPVPPEIKQFVCSLAHLKLERQLAGVTFFLLGAGRNFGISDPFALLDPEMEMLSPFLDGDVERAASMVNQQGARPLAPAQLQQRIAALRQDLQLADVRAVCKAIATRLVQLRMEVGA